MKKLDPDLNRREFLSTVVRTGTAVLVAPVVTSLGVTVVSGCSDSNNSDKGSGGSGGTTVYAVVPVGGHTHTFSIPNATLSAPPAGGFSARTSSSVGHTHQISLTQADLINIAANTSVAGNTTINQAHQHAYSFPI